MARRPPPGPPPGPQTTPPDAAPQAPPAAPGRPLTPHERQARYNALRQAGHTIENAMAQAGYRPGSRSYVTQHVERKRERKLLSAYVPAAKRVVREMLNGKVPPGTERAKAGDLLRAAAMILDCEEPVVQKIQTQNVHAVLTPERRRRIAAALGLAPEPEGPPALEAGPPGKPGPAS